MIRYYADGRAAEISGFTRSHSLAEMFSAFTGRGVALRMADGTLKHKRLSLRLAARAVSQIYARLEFVDLAPAEVLSVIKKAKDVGAQGGRIHDLMHAAAAEKAGAKELWTLDENDFGGLSNIPVKQLR